MSLYVGNSSVIEWADVTSVLTGELDTTGSYSATVYDLSGDPVPGQSWPVALSHVPTVPGTYRGAIESVVELRAGQRYDVTLTGTAGSGEDVSITQRLTAVVRTD